MKKENCTQTLKLARDFIRVAEKHAEFKRTEGYIEDNYSFFEILNLDACMDICNRGPADFYYEKAYELMLQELGADHPETRQLAQEIINYHLNNAKRMMYERFFFAALISIPVLYLLIPELYPKVWHGILVFISSYAILTIYWYLETTLVCHLEKKEYLNSQ